MTSQPWQKIAMHICTIYHEADWDVTSFMFPISSFFYDQKFNTKAIKVQIKSIFQHFQ